MSTDFRKLVSDANEFFPKNVEHVELDEVCLVIGGKGWSFSTTSPWRYSSMGKYYCGSEDVFRANILREITDSIVIGVEYKNDVTIKLENALLEVFSCVATESWIFRLEEYGAIVHNFY